MNHQATRRCCVGLATLIYLALLWFVSGIALYGGIYVFLSGAVCWAAALLAYRQGRRRPLYAVALLLLILAVTVGALEGALRVEPGLLTGKVANYAYGAYHFLPGGMYQRDPHLGYRLRPSFSRDVYWNGHWWHHATNAAGFRGELVDRADAVFLGDSMIYGHGVENADTVSSQFGARTGLPVANLGQQGACVIQNWIRFRELAERLHPHLVFVCSHPNVSKVGAMMYGIAELQRFLALPVSDATEPLVQPWFQPRPAGNLKYFWLDHMALPLRTAGALYGLGVVCQARMVNAQTAPEVPDSRAAWEKAHGVPSAAWINTPFDPEGTGTPATERLGWQAHCHALAKMKYLCEQQGAQLVLFDLGYPRAFSEAIERQAQRLGVDYSAVGRVALTRALAGEDIYLANDGHWSPRGCAVVAEDLTKYAPRPCLNAGVRP